MIYCKHGKRILIQNWYAKLVARIFTSLWFCTFLVLCLIVWTRFLASYFRMEISSLWKVGLLTKFCFHIFYLTQVWSSPCFVCNQITQIVEADDSGCFCLHVVFSASIHHNLWPVSFMKSGSNIGDTRHKFWGALLRTFSVWNTDSGSSSSQSCPILEEHL